MDIFSAILTVVGSAAAQVLKDVYQDWQTGRKVRKGVAVDAQGNQQIIVNVSGVLAGHDSTIFRQNREDVPTFVSGIFTFEDNFSKLLIADNKPLIILLIMDQETHDIYFYQFDLNGYAISLWTGIYSFYVLMVDPLQDKVIGVGYPFPDSSSDANPIIISDEVPFSMDFLISNG